MIHDIAFAKDHQVWLATSVGLVQFDGVHWTRWGKREGVPESAVTAIEFDSQGDLWIGTEHGLGSLRGRTFHPQLDLGPVSVRRLVADTLGSVWLCIERQPSRMDTVARWIDGQWHWVRTDPKATDLVASGDRIFVVANQRLGEIVRDGVEWLPDLPPFAPPGSRLTIAAEPVSADKTQTGYILVATQTATLGLIDGVWFQHHGHSAVQGGPVVRTANGTFLGLSVDGQRLWRMKSSLLRPKSERLLSDKCALHGLAEAPDRALWGFGEGSIVRYPTQNGSHEQVPPALYTTAAGLWCSNGQHVFRFADDGLVAQTEITGLLAQSYAGDVLATTTTPGSLALLPADGSATRFANSKVPHQSRLRAVFDRRGVAWLFYDGGDGPRVVVLDQSGSATPIDSPILQASRLQDIKLAVGAPEGVWLCTSGADETLRFIHLGPRGGFEDHPPERFTRPSMVTLEDGRIAAIGQSGVWVRSPDGRWCRIEDPVTKDAMWLGAAGDLLLIGCDMSSAHRSGLVTFDGTSTIHWLVPEPRLVGCYPDRLFVASVEEIICVDKRGLPVLLTNDSVRYNGTALTDAKGNTWVSEDGRARCLRGPSGPPMCRIGLETANPVATRQVRLRVWGNYPYLPWSESNPSRFTYRWRIHGGAWSKDVPASQPLELEMLAGLHEIDAIISDALGRASRIATTIVDVAPLPLQRRTWFPWAVATIAVLLLGLSAHAFVSHRRLAAQAGRLRVAVDKRTRKIRSELVRRIRVERHLRHQQRVLALLATGKPIDSALEALVVGVEERLPGWRGAAMLPSGDSLLPVAMPNLTDQQRAFLLDCKLADRHLACVMAFHERRRFTITDANTEPNAVYRQAGVGAVCAQPIVSSQGSPSGVLLMLHGEPSTPTREQFEILEAAAHIASLAIESKHGETERQRLQQEMLDAQKLRSLGLLAGGIAHDFNNLLTGILGNAGLARMQSVIGSPVDDALIQVEVATNRAAELCTQLLAYSGRGRFTVKPIDLSMVVREMTQMLRLSMSRRVSLELTLDPSLPSVEADATQLRQVLMNLIGNAAEAIGDRDGLVAITTGTANLSETQLRSCVAELRTTAGRHVFVRVADTGCGMSETVRRSMFDPFFTTKATGRGLGLAAVLGIVQGHRGAIDIESEVGRGTSITVYLPASDKPAEHETTTSFTPPALRGSGCALIVEDEVIVRDLATSLLSSVGFEVASVADGESAVTYLQEHASTLSLVLLDIVLPRIDGQEVLRRLRAIRSDLPVILSSGNDIVDNDAIREDDDFTLFLKKPYGPRTLLDALRTILARGKPVREA